MNTERLLKLADHLEELDTQFRKEYNSEPFFTMTSWESNPAGVTADIEEFKELFRVVPDGNAMFHPYDVLSNTVGWNAVANFYGVSVHESQRLFSYYYYDFEPSLKVIAEHIRDFVQEKSEV